MKSPHELSAKDAAVAAKLQKIITHHLEAMTKEASKAGVEVDMFITLLLMTVTSNAYSTVDHTEMLDVMYKEARRLGSNLDEILNEESQKVH